MKRMKIRDDSSLTWKKSRCFVLSLWKEDKKEEEKDENNENKRFEFDIKIRTVIVKKKDEKGWKQDEKNEN